MKCQQLLPLMQVTFLVVAASAGMPHGVSGANPAIGSTQKSSDDLAVARFEKRYALQDGQVIKRVPSPFSDDRMAYYRNKNFGQFKAIPEGPDIMFLHFENGKVKNWGMTFGGTRLSNVMQMVAKVHRQEIEAADVIENTELSGDFVFRPDASRDELIDGLMEILRGELNLPWKHEWREVERDVIVVTGNYQYTPLLPSSEQIHLFGAMLNENGSGGGSSGKFDAFLKDVGQWLDMPVVNEVASPPDGSLVWRYHNAFDGDDELRQLAKNPDVVLTNLHLQTALNYVVEKRTVPLLFIESHDAK